MAIPPFNEHGYLPAGQHAATLEEVLTRFCAATPTRQSMEQPLRQLISIAGHAHAVAVLLGGSFVTDKPSPGDVDSILLFPDKLRPTPDVLSSLQQLHRDTGFDIERLRVGDHEGIHEVATLFFGHDRNGIPKGLIRIIP